MSRFNNLTLGELQGDFRPFAPELAERIDVLLAGTYDEFVRIVNTAMDRVIECLEENAEVRCNDGEDRLTIELVGLLRQRGFDAGHDSMVRGHVDIVVRHRNGYVWLAEAKIHTNDYEWIFKGFQQLCTRYSTGTPGHSSGALLIYIRDKNAARVITRWEDRLKSRHSDLTSSQCNTRSKLAFYSQHQHLVSGLPYSVRHMAVCLHFKPEDK